MKPWIRKRGGEWVCTTKRFGGIGPTPRAAYWDWFRDYGGTE